MAEITAAMVKELRDKTGAGMMDAKKALVETGGKMDDAVDWLRKKGLSTAEKKSSRTAAEGLVALATSGTCGAVLEVNAETDFVGRNAEFQAYVSKVGSIALKGKIESTQTLADTPYEGGRTVGQGLTDLIAKIGENMALRRVACLEVKKGVVAGYIHNAAAPGLGKIGVLVALESEGRPDALQALGRQLAMHVAAAFPQFLRREDVDAATLDRERAIVREQAKASGKPADIVEKMVEGRMGKYYGEICLLEQVYVIDGESKISAVLENAAKDVGAPVALTGFVRFQLGEGIEKEEKDFAAEVAAVVNG